MFANFSQAQNNYDSLWKQVDKHQLDGLPKSSLEVVNQIEATAKKENNNPQIIKSLLFKSKYALILEEDAQLKIINDFKSEIETATTPTKNVLENILANLYWQYFQQNRWKFYDRTNTAAKVDTEDFRTWDLQTLFNEVHAHFENSLQNGLILKQTPIEAFKVILQKQKDSEKFRPTLFDLLAHNALKFYKTNETSITQPAYKFVIDNADFLSDSNTFSKLNITSKDSTSLQLNALKIYQDLTAFHLKNTNPTALADVNIERLLFVRQFGTFPDKNTQLLASLKTESDALKSHEVSALYDFEIASIYYEQGITYLPKISESYRWKLKDAVALCNAIVETYPNSKGGQKASLLKHQIEQQQLQITTEAYLPIQQNTKLLINYKNVDGLSFVVHKISESDYFKLNNTYRKDEQLKLIQGLKNKVTFWQNNLKNEGDYQSHKIEVAIPKLDNGRYLVFTSPNNYSNTFGYAVFQVTNLALVEKTERAKQTFQVIDRNNGKPIANAKVKLTYTKNYREQQVTKNLVSNANGEVHLEKINKRLSNIKVEVVHANEKAYFGNYYANRSYKDQPEKEQYKGFLFTDRSIYRPGQTVYFKGIALKTFENTSQVLPNDLLKITLHNVNGEEIAKRDLKTNEFGSISGEFVLPNGGLTGQYYMQFTGQNNLNAYVNFSVEEYKRPKFEATFNPITNTFKVNDSITIKGKALAYAGSSICLLYTSPSPRD